MARPFHEKPRVYYLSTNIILLPEYIVHFHSHTRWVFMRVGRIRHMLMGA